MSHITAGQRKSVAFAYLRQAAINAFLSGNLFLTFYRWLLPFPTASLWSAHVVFFRSSMSSIAQIHYQLAIANHQQHLFAVTLQIASPPKQLQLRMPAWIPGSYKIRDFAKNIVQIQAVDNQQQPIEIQKVDKQCWQLQTNQQAICIEYLVYAFDFSVRGAYVSDQYALVNGTCVFLQVNTGEQPCSLEIKPDSLPAHWQVTTSLPNKASFGHYQAANYAELIDHPLLMGVLEQQNFSVANCKFALIIAGGHRSDLSRISNDLAAICQQHINYFGQPAPFEHYQFLTVLCENGFGGLEHLNSTLLMYPRAGLPLPGESARSKEYQRFLSLCSHELFHAWLVKRIQPQAMRHPNLAQEVHFNQLWIYEGFTSYLDDQSLLKAGLVSTDDYLNTLAEQLTRLHNTPGKQKQNLYDASFDAWSKLYQMHADSPNLGVSYYNKGAVVALCLDLTLRQRSNNQISLQQVLQRLWQDYGQKQIGTPDNVIEQIVDGLGVNLTEELTEWTQSTGELPVAGLLREVGIDYQLCFSQQPAPKWALGITSKAAENGVRVEQVAYHSPASVAGLQPNDLLLSINHWQVSHNNLQSILDASQGEQATLHLLRDGRLLSLSMPLQPAQPDKITLKVTNPELADAWLEPVALSSTRSI